MSRQDYRHQESLWDRWSSAKIYQKWGIIAAVLAVVALGVWSIAPLGVVRYILVAGFWMHPTGWVLILTTILLTGLLLWKERNTAATVFAVAACIALITYAVFSHGLSQYYLVKDLNPTVIEVLPDSTYPRFLPFGVGAKFAAVKVQDSRHHIGDLDPLLDSSNGEMNFVGPRVPTGLWNQLTGQMDGFEVVYPNGQVSTIHQAMKYGEGMYFRDNIAWPLRRTHYTVDLPEYYYVLQDDEVLALAPYVRYVYRFPVRVPTWGGVFVIHADGQIEDLSPEAAMADSRFTGQRLYPEDLAKRIGRAWAYRNGVINAWFVHKDQTEVPTIADEDNQMPYLLPTGEGPEWFIGMEPYGPAYSIFKMLFINAHTGEIGLHEIAPESGITGPNAAISFVKAKFPGYTWYGQGGDEACGTMLAVEPRPLIRDGVLYWQLSITTKDYASVTLTVLANGKDNSVIYFNNLAELQRFLVGKFRGYTTSGGTAETSSEQSQTSATAVPGDLQGLTPSQLYDLQRQIIDELERRAG